MCSTPPSPATPVGVETAEWLEPKTEADEDGGDGFYEDTWPMETEWPEGEQAWDGEHGDGTSFTKSEWNRKWDSAWYSASQVNYASHENYYKYEDDQVHNGGNKWHGKKVAKDAAWSKPWVDRRSQSTSSGSSGRKGTYVRGGYVSPEGKFFT
ncbi:unnamed protein product, partial [Symbiodinium sp. CCMP2592]